jgi:hypothetical protein
MTNKKSYWPLALVFVFVIFIGWLVTFIVFSSRQRIDLVSPDYYARGIDHQRQIERETRTLATAHTVTVRHDAHTGTIILYYPDTNGPSEGRLTLYRPSNADLDKTFALELDDSGEQIISASGLPGGLWKARMEWTLDGEEFYREETLVLPRRTGVVE